MHRATSTAGLEHALGDRVRALLPHWAATLILFGLKQAWACLFGGLLLAALLLSKAIWRPDWPIARYDALLLFAVIVQAAFLWARLETWAEARVILLFHLTGTVMEWFKVGAGSWAYPEPAVMKLLGVPLFSGFMYAAVGSYIARVIRIFDMRFAPYPRFDLTLALAAAIYVNFFTHHVMPDMRVALFAATAALYGRTWVWFTIGQRSLRMPMLLAALLTSFFLWLAENIGTSTGTWLYGGQTTRQMVGLAKMGSWYLLLYVSFATVTLVLREPFKEIRASKAPARKVRHKAPG